MSYLHLVRSDCPVPDGTSIIAYCRDSGGDDQERSVAQQIAAIREYCKKHRLVLEHIYADEAKKSSNTEKRDDLNVMLADIRARFPTIHNRARRDRRFIEQTTAILLWKSNRIGRDAVECAYLNSDFQMRALTVFGLVDAIETGNAALDGVIGAVRRLHDQQVLDDISADTKRGLAQIVGMRDTDMSFIIHNPQWPTRDGRYLGIMPGTTPVGFVTEKISLGVNRRGEKREVQRLVPDPDKWDAAKLAWQLRAAGASLRTIHNTTRLFRNTNGYTRFFRNRIYTGDLDYGGQRYENFVPAMISREMYEAEQARIAKVASEGEAHPRSRGSRHLLSGLVFCGYHEHEAHSMHASTNRRRSQSAWDYYACTHRKNTRGEGCRMPSVSAKALTTSVVNFLLEEILTFEHLKSVALQMSHALLDGMAEARVKLAALERKLLDTRRAIENLADAIERGGGTEDIFSRIRKRRGELNLLEKEIVELQTRINDADTLSLPTDEKIRDWIESTRRALTGEDVETARMMIRALVSKIVLPTKNTAVVYYTPPLFHANGGMDVLTPTGLRPVFVPVLEYAGRYFITLR